MNGFVLIKLAPGDVLRTEGYAQVRGEVVSGSYRLSALLESAPVQDELEQEALNDVHRNYREAVAEFGDGVKLRPYLGIFGDPERVAAVQGLKLHVPDEKANAELQADLALQYPALPPEGDPDDDVVITIDQPPGDDDELRNAEFAAGILDDDESAPADTEVWSETPKVGETLKQ